MTLIDTFLDIVISKVNAKFNDNNEFNERLQKFNEHECLERNRPESCDAYGNALLQKDCNPVKAAKIFQKNCIKNRYARSCYNYGNLRVGIYSFLLKPGHKTNFPSINPAVALDFFQIGCDEGFPGSCFNAGVIKTMGIKNTKQLGIPPEYYKTPITTKPPKCVTIDNGTTIILPSDLVGDIHNIKDYSNDTKKEIIDFFVKGCDTEFSRSCLEAAKIYSYGYHGDSIDLKSDYELAVKYCKKGCQYDDINSCYLGHDLIVSGRAKTYSLKDAEDLILQADSSIKQSLMKK